MSLQLYPVLRKNKLLAMALLDTSNGGRSVVHGPLCIWPRLAVNQHGHVRNTVSGKFISLADYWVLVKMQLASHTLK